MVARVFALSRVVAAVAMLLTMVQFGVSAPRAHADDGAIRLQIDLTLAADGVLEVSTTATVPEGASAASRLPLEIPVEGNRTQRFEVSDIEASDGAAATVDGSALSISVPGGTSTVRYSVRGTVADGTELQQFTWVLAAGWSAPVERLTGSFSSPSTRPDSPICAYGELGVRRLCSVTQTAANGQVTFENAGLARGNVAVFSVLLPPGTATATATFTAAGSASSPRSDTAGAIGLGCATALAALGCMAAWLRRRTDEAATRTSGPVPDLLVPRDGTLAFASPDAVLPGQIGALTTGRVRPSDIGATLLDLAVRNYLWIAEVPNQNAASGFGDFGDFQISRRADLDGTVSEYERAVVAAVFPADRGTVTARELVESTRSVDLRAARAAVGRSVVANGWVRRPVRAVELAATAVACLGVLAAVGLAFAGTGALWAVAVAVLAAGLAVACRLLPARTTRGTRLVAALGGFGAHLATVDPQQISPAGRALLLQRALPYAHALGALRLWLDLWSTSRPEPFDWYQATRDQSPFGALLVLAAVLDGVAAQCEAAEPE